MLFDSTRQCFHNWPDCRCSRWLVDALSLSPSVSQAYMGLAALLRRNAPTSQILRSIRLISLDVLVGCSYSPKTNLDYSQFLPDAEQRIDSAALFQRNGQTEDVWQTIPCRRTLNSSNQYLRIFYLPSWLGSRRRALVMAVYLKLAFAFILPSKVEVARRRSMTRLKNDQMLVRVTGDQDHPGHQLSRH